MPQPTTRRAARLTGLAAATFAALYAIAVLTAHGQHLDTVAMTRAATISPTLTAWAEAALAHYHERAYAAAATVLLLAGLAARGPRRAAVAGATLLGIVVSAEALKHGLPRPDLTWVSSAIGSDNSFPSGHTAGVAGLASALVVLSPRRLRPTAVLLGVLATVVVGAALVVAQWHRPSDIAGSAALATAWCAAGVAVAEAAVRRPALGQPIGVNISSTAARGTSSTRA